MLTVFSQQQLLHEPTREMHRGDFLPPFETPERAVNILAEIQSQGIGEVVEPAASGLDPVLRTHSEDYVSFLRDVWKRWQSLGCDGEVVPHVWPARTLRGKRPDSIYGQLGYYSFDAGTTIAAGTWMAALASAHTAVTAADYVAHGASTFALCRPPGHHAAKDLFGGYCFLNNAAIAAEHLLAANASRVAILDVDYHHGNGTQEIFYERDDVLFISIHADPREAYPYFIGYPDEVGSGQGEGFNRNFALPNGTDWPQYQQALAAALDQINSFDCDALVLSLGVDTFAGDPISGFRLRHEDFTSLGREIGSIGKPVLTVMEGGYALDDVGRNVTSVLAGIEYAS